MTTTNPSWARNNRRGGPDEGAERRDARVVQARFLAAFCLALLLTTAPLRAQPEGVGRAGTLYLKNGDYVSGRVDTSDEGQEIRWKTSLFQESIRFDVRGISHISYYTPPHVETPSTARPRSGNPLVQGFRNLLNQLPRVPAPTPAPGETAGTRIELVGGQVLFGNVQSADDEYLHMDSSRHGSLRINRTRLRELDGVANNASLLFDGSGNLAAWTTLTGNEFSLEDWQSQGRDLVTTKTGANLYYQPPSTDRFVCEVTLSGDESPEFQLVFGLGNSMADIKNAFSLETWDGDLVIHRQAGDPLQHAALTRQTWKPSGWSLPLEIYCDPDNNQLTVFSRGKLLGQLQTPDQPKLASRGLLIRNRGRQLKVTQARMRRWNGPMQQEAREEGNDVVVLTDGSWLTGQMTSFDRAQNQLRLMTGEGPRTLPVDRIDRIRFHAPADVHPAAPAETSIEIAYLDGGALQGRYLRADDQGLWLATDFADQPVLAGWRNLLEVRLTTDDPPDESLAKNGLVEHAGCSLHGRVLSGAGPAELRWEPVGSQHSVAFLSTRTTRVTFEPRDHRPTLDRLFSELSLVNGDTIPCMVESVDDQFVTARFAAGEVSRIPREYFKALRDFRPENWIYGGFAPDDHWYANRRQRDLFRLRDGAVELYGDVLLAREMSLPDRFRVSFDVRFVTNGTLVVGIGADSVANALDRGTNRGITAEMMEKIAKAKPDGLIEIMLTRDGRVVSAQGVSRVAGLLAMFFQANMLGVEQPRNPTLPLGNDGSLHVDLLVDRPARQYVILGNGQEMYRWRDPTPLQGQVVHFGIGDDNGNNSRRTAQPPEQPRVVLYNFRIGRWPGLIADDHLNRFLTRRMGASDKAVTHALRAVNGDNLRGRLLQIKDDQILFQSRLDTLTIPRRTVVDVISLHADPEAAVAGMVDPDAVPVRVNLWGGGVVTLRQLRASEQFVLGQSALAGPVSVPWTAVATIEFGGQADPHPAFGDWVLRDPPPLPSFDEAAAQQQSDWLNKQPPDFNVDLLDGAPLTLSSLRGRPVVLDFWATWCGPCIASMPSMIELARDFEGKVEFIAINQQEDPEEVREFVTSRLWNLRVGLDVDGSLNRLFGVNAIPYTLIIDPQGVVRHVHIGATPDLKAELTEVLNGLLPADGR